MNKPRLGDRVAVTRYWDKPTHQEVERLAADGEEIATLQRRELTEPMVGVVVGRTRVPTEAPINVGWDGDSYPDWRSGTAHRTLYTVKRSFRERRYLVDVADMQEVPKDDA